MYAWSQGSLHRFAGLFKQICCVTHVLNNFSNINWCSIQDWFLGGAGQNLFGLLEISFPWVFQQYMKQPYFNEHPFLFILESRINFWVGWAKFYLFFEFLKSSFHGLSNDIWLNHIQLWTPIFGNFWTGQEVGGAGQNVFGLKELPECWVTTVCSMKTYVCIVWSKKLSKWADGWTDLWTLLSSSSAEVESSSPWKIAG